MNKCCYCKKEVNPDENLGYFHDDCYCKFEEWKNEQDGMICPHCGYEFEGYEKPYEEGSEDTKCPDCGKMFIYEAEINWSWRTYKREEDFSLEVEE